MVIKFILKKVIKFKWIFLMYEKLISNNDRCLNKTGKSANKIYLELNEIFIKLSE